MAPAIPRVKFQENWRDIMIKLVLLSLPAFCLAISAANWFAAARADVKSDLATAVKGNNDFAFDLYGQLRQGDGNMFFSPYSVSTALAMTYAGANGKTADEMAKTLHFTLEPDRLHAAMAELHNKLTAPDAPRTFKVAIANALWGQKGYAFRPEFINTMRHYGAGLQQVDFAGATEQARQTINQWVEEQTNNKIKNLLQPGVLKSDTPLVLTNAIYFKAAWMNQFWDKLTKPEAFHLAGGKDVDVPMMHQASDLSFAETDDMQIIELPYTQRELSMLVLLPKKTDGLAALEKTLSAANLSAGQSKMKTHHVELSLPKFKTTAGADLKETLIAMGMPSAFSRQSADFSGMTTTPDLMIGAVIHKAFVDVNELGTEAAAATAVVMAPRGVPRQQPPKAVFRADHPFVYLIRDNATGSILFTGRVVKPQG
jgi:serpin B